MFFAFYLNIAVLVSFPPAIDIQRLKIVNNFRFFETLKKFVTCTIFPQGKYKKIFNQCRNFSFFQKQKFAFMSGRLALVKRIYSRFSTVDYKCIYYLIYACKFSCKNS